jgi:hypothetical protein
MPTLQKTSIQQRYAPLNPFFYAWSHFSLIRMRISIASLTSVLLFFTFASHSRADEIISLITDEEAALPIPKSPTSPIPQATEGGPKINIIQPESTTIPSNPFAVKVTFTAAPDAKIDVDSLRLDCLLGIIRLSLVDRLAGHVTTSGIDVSQVKVPAGKYTIEFSIADTKGRRAHARQTWHIE